MLSPTTTTTTSTCGRPGSATPTRDERRDERRDEATTSAGAGAGAGGRPGSQTPTKDERPTDPRKNKLPASCPSGGQAPTNNLDVLRKCATYFASYTSSTKSHVLSRICCVCDKICLRSHPGTLKAHLVLEGCIELTKFYLKNQTSTIFSCCFCNKSFLTNLTVLKHVFDVHSNISILCCLCDVTISIFHIKTHKYMHLMAEIEKPIFCKKCKLPYSAKEMIIHLTEPPHLYSLSNLTKPILERACMITSMRKLTVACLMYCKEQLINKAHKANDACSN